MNIQAKLFIYFLAVLLALAPFFGFGMGERVNNFTAVINGAIAELLSN